MVATQSCLTHPHVWTNKVVLNQALNLEAYIQYNTGESLDKDTKKYLVKKLIFEERKTILLVTTPLEYIHKISQIALDRTHTKGEQTTKGIDVSD